MGVLIMTKGTKRLIAHYNDEFDTWLSFYRQAGNITQFDRYTYGRANNNIDIWTDLVVTLTDNTAGHSKRNDNLTLLPAIDNGKHRHLHARWKYFLQTILTQDNRNKLADYLFQALSNNSIQYILFDVVHQMSQDVFLDRGTDDAVQFAKITICTVSMPTQPHTPGGHDPDPLD
jgi:hypothetical protein